MTLTKVRTILLNQQQILLKLFATYFIINEYCSRLSNQLRGGDFKSTDSLTMDTHGLVPALCVCLNRSDLVTTPLPVTQQLLFHISGDQVWGSG